jgi:hypothetical protein
MVLEYSLRFAALYCDLVKAYVGRKLIDTAAKALRIRTKEQCVYLGAIERRIHRRTGQGDSEGMGIAEWSARGIIWSLQGTNQESQGGNSDDSMDGYNNGQLTEELLVEIELLKVSLNRRMEQLAERKLSLPNWPMRWRTWKRRKPVGSNASVN